MHRDDRREEFQRYLDKGEAMMVTDDKKDNAIREAFAIFFSGSKDSIREGLKIYDEMRRHALRQYLARLKWATIEREERLNPGLRAFIQTEA